MFLKRLTPRVKNNSAIILLSVLWVLAILTFFALSLGRRSNIELTLTKHMVGQLRAKYIAWGGFIYAVEQIRQDTADPQSNLFDTRYQCAIPSSSGKSPTELFQKVPLGSGYFTVQYKSPDSDFQPKTYYGFQDEEAKININALTPQNYTVMTALLGLLGVDNEQAQTIAFSLIDWIDEDSILSDDSKGAEDDYYKALPKSYHCKNLLFNSLEELILVRGMTKEIFKKIKPYLTLFPHEGELMVNFDTASPIVLRAFARSVAGPVTNTEISDADSLVDKLLEYRQGNDGMEASLDDRTIDLQDMSLNAKEKVIFLVINQFRARTSDFIRVQVTGVDEISSIQSRSEAVIQRDNLSIVFWSRN